MTSFKDILRQAGDTKEIATECGVSTSVVYRWGERGPTLGKHLAGIIRVSDRNRSGVTADMLIEALDKP